MQGTVLCLRLKCLEEGGSFARLTSILLGSLSLLAFVPALHYLPFRSHAVLCCRVALLRHGAVPHAPMCMAFRDAQTGSQTVEVRNTQSDRLQVLLFELIDVRGDRATCQLPG